MPKIDMAAYEAAEVKEGGSFPRLKAGGYVAKIIGFRDKWHDRSGNLVTCNDKQYVKLLFDIAEGELAGMFSDDYYYGEEMDNRHWICLSWKNLGALKGNMQAFEDSNPGFDPMAAFEADAWGQFVGRLVGIVVGEEEYERNGEVRTSTGLPNLRSVERIRSGKFKVPELKKLKGDGYQQPTQAAVGNDDIPF